MRKGPSTTLPSLKSARCVCKYKILYCTKLYIYVYILLYAVCACIYIYIYIIYITLCCMLLYTESMVLVVVSCTGTMVVVVSCTGTMVCCEC